MMHSRQADSLSRREVLRLGSAFGLALTLPDLFRAQGQARPPGVPSFGQAKSVIVLYLHGGGYVLGSAFGYQPHAGGRNIRAK